MGLKANTVMSKDLKDELVSAYLDEELPPHLQEHLGGKLAGTEANRAVAAELTAVKRLLRERLQPAAEPEGFWDGVHRRIVAEARSLPQGRASWVPRRSRWLVPALATAGLAAALLTVRALRPRADRPAVVPSTVPLTNGLSLASLIDSHVHHGAHSCLPAKDFADPVKATAWLQQQVGFTPTVPDLARVGLALVRVGPCVCVAQTKDHPAALYGCRTAAGQRVGVYQLSPQNVAWNGGGNGLLGECACRVRHRGSVAAVAWESGRCLYGVTGDVAEDNLVRVSRGLYSGQQCPGEQ
ncbi:MAG: hypothetical protein CO096_35645 [Armatimonadetes bacterium CG_4_9_14_3_um_filter_66_14]|nr:MAG: hypothetical protein CO096_35645 [Armatimonadetes bacterium CG_4_9_14_3_um_filter_66_14]